MKPEIVKITLYCGWGMVCLYTGWLSWNKLSKAEKIAKEKNYTEKQLENFRRVWDVILIFCIILAAQSFFKAFK